MVYNALLSKQLMLEVRTRWDDEEHMLAAAHIIQSTGPVNSHVTPTPFEMGGYADPIVMAWTGFIQGESGTVKIEGLSAELKSLL